MKNLLTFIFLIVSISSLGQIKQQAVSQHNCVSSFDSLLQRQIYTFVDSMPEYPGGMTALLAFFFKNFIYPKEQTEFQGSIHLTFIVEEDGSLSNINSYTRNHKEKTLVDKEAIRVFPMGIPVGREINVRM